MAERPAELAFDLAWLSSSDGDAVERATFAALTITAGTDRVPITEIDDVIAQTVRSDIRVPTLQLAEWLVVNWWRLRWEPRAEKLSPTWLRAHSMASTSTDVPWPALQVTSDGAFLRLEARAEQVRDVAAIRYLRDIDISIPAAHFERGVDGFLTRLDARIASCVPDDRELAELIDELRIERSNPKLVRACKLQAMAGFDPGASSARSRKSCCVRGRLSTRRPTRTGPTTRASPQPPTTSSSRSSWCRPRWSTTGN